jgi:hypothetical protein
VKGVELLPRDFCPNRHPELGQLDVSHIFESPMRVGDHVAGTGQAASAKLYHGKPGTTIVILFAPTLKP